MAYDDRSRGSIFRVLADCCLVAAAVGLWLAWALMPDAGTKDAAHIVQVMAGARERVYWSAIMQLVACALFAPGVMVAARRGSRTTLVGASLLLIGVMGMAADAVYHQAANQMAAPDVATREVRLVLARMQTDDIHTLVPLMLAYPVGVIVLTWGLAREHRISRWVARIALASLLAVPGGMLAIRFVGVSGKLVFLGVLGLLSAALVGVGLRRLRAR